MRALVIGAVAAVALGIGPDPVRTAIRALVVEADQYRSAPETLPAAPDYAARAATPFEPDDLIDALTRLQMPAGVDISIKL